MSDNGPGVPKALREQIFQPFFTTKAEGLGMGLAISRSILETHGGRLRVAKRRRGGTIFYASLPVNAES